MTETRRIELSAGTVEYEETGGGGPVVLFVPRRLMDSTLWDSVVADLSRDHRCLVPTFPLGAHRYAMRPDADLSLAGLTRMLQELLERLELSGVTVVGNDTGGAIVQLLAAADAERLAQIVLVSCDAFDNFPPGLTGRALVLTGRLPTPFFGAFMQQMRLKPVRRLPIAFGWLTKRGDGTSRRWLEPLLRQPEIRRDTVRLLRSIAKDRQLLERAAEQLAGFSRPALVIWAEEDRVMPLEHGRRLTRVLPNARLVTVADSYTLIPLDQPAELAAQVRAFIRSPSGDTR
jgi:pimeloyl-ACP methyl ester carboxylesterase